LHSIKPVLWFLSVAPTVGPRNFGTESLTSKGALILTHLIIEKENRFYEEIPKVHMFEK